MKIQQTLVTVLLAAIISFAVVKMNIPAQAVNQVTETRLDKIKRTGVLRCGYSIWPPALTKDPNTGAFSGFFFELMEEIGKQVGVKIEWTAEATPAHMFSDLNTDRYDVVCSPFLALPSRAMVGLFTIPIFYNSSNLYARADDTRFDNNFAAANSADIKFAAIDGSFTAILATRNFPSAQMTTLPEYANASDTFMSVVDKKADLVISEPLTFALFIKKNPNVMKRVEGAPLSIFGASMPLPAKEYDLKFAIDGALTYLQSSGVVEKIISKHEAEGAKTLRLAKPYVFAE